MCGINGFIKFDVPKINEGSLEIMNNSIIHRGPDDQGTFSENNVGLGHVRLSIIDLSARGHQPMVYEHNQKKVIITFNGEIYNFKELRTELEKEGYRFSSMTRSSHYFLVPGIDSAKNLSNITMTKILSFSARK